MSDGLVSFTLRTDKGVCDGHSYRLSTLPRIGETFVDGSDSFRVRDIHHNARGTITVFADQISFRYV